LKRIKDLLPTGKGSRAGSSDDPRAAGTPEQDESGSKDSDSTETTGAEKEDDLYDIDALFAELDGIPGKEDEEKDDLAATPVSDRGPPAHREARERPSSSSPGEPLKRTAAVDTTDPAGSSEPSSPPTTSPELSVMDREISSLRQAVTRLEISVEGLERDMKNLEGRQRATERNIEDLLKVYKLVSRQLKPFSTGEGPISGGLQEHKLRSGMKTATDGRSEATSKGGRLIEEPERPGGPGTRMQGKAPPSRYGRPQPFHPGYETGNGRRRRAPLLATLRNDYATTVLVLRWIEFLLGRVKRSNISALLDYYEDIGWISPTVKTNIMAYARGEVQDVNAYGPDLKDSMTPFAVCDESSPVLDDQGTPVHPHHRPMDDWKLSAEDHLKSLLFIKKIAGCRIDKDELNTLEQEISVMKYSLRRYHEV